MGLEFSSLWALCLIPAAAAIMMIIDRRYRHGTSSLKRRVTLIARLLLATVLGLAVAAPSLPLNAGETVRWVLLDVSDSAKGDRARMEALASAALSQLPKGEKGGVIAFGNGAMVELTPSAEPVFSQSRTAVQGDDSDLGDALMLLNALLPSGGGGSALVISDGAAQASQTALDLMKARGITVDGVTVAKAQRPDAQLSQLTAPAEVYEGQTVPLEAVIDANAFMSGTLALYQNGQWLDSREVSLNKGENRFAFSQTAQATGVVHYEARLMANDDSQSQNNSAAATVRVSGAPAILLVSDTDNPSGLFKAAGLKLTVARPGELPAAAEDYLPYDGVILSNIDYDAATEAQWRALSSAVTALGRGLCVLGGDQSYALGGYRGTLLEELLPVRIDVKNKLRLPSLSLVIAIDKSGSMTAGQFGTSRIEVAKEAAISALGVLTERDAIGVIGFDDTAKWVVPFQPVTDAAAVESLIGTLRADGGTAFYSAMQQALETLGSATTAQKHVIFLSDGQPGDSGFEELAAAMRQAGITLTTVAVGGDADVRLMTRLASIGGGQHYQADEFTNVPKIFAKDTMLAGGSYVQNRLFTPVVAESGALTDYTGFPALTGYLSATEKETATVSLLSDTDDPLLCRWNAGAGKVLCWLSDAEGAWTENYLRWSDAPAFFGGMVSAVLPGADREGTLTAAIDGQAMTITYTLPSPSETALPTQAVVIAPNGGETAVTLSPTADGVYEGTAPAEQQGAYALRVTQQLGDGAARTQESGVVKPYAKEYDLRNSDASALQRLVALTGGRMLQEGDPVWLAAKRPSGVRQSLRPALTLLALALLLLDIALRKLPWDDALLTLTGRQAQRAHQRQAAKPEKKKRPPKTGRRAQAAHQEQEAAQTVDALLKAQKARKG